MYGIVYKITNKINGKGYVGITTKTLAERFSAHCGRAISEKSAVQKAIRKYGRKNFSIEAIDSANTKEELIEKEISWIEKLNTFKGYGYNLTLGGEGVSQMSELVKAKISKTKTGKKVPKLQGKEVTKSARVKISRTLGGNKVKLTNLKTGKVIILDWLNQARDYGLNPTLIHAVIKGTRNHHKNYTAMYINHANTEETLRSKTLKTP